MRRVDRPASGQVPDLGVDTRMTNEPTPTTHRWADCEMCGRMVVCGKCGNNCCNGGYGEMDHGIVCDACPEAYEVQDKGEVINDAVN
jgi:hypothetical protein